MVLGVGVTNSLWGTWSPGLQPAIELIYETADNAVSALGGLAYPEAHQGAIFDLRAGRDDRDIVLRGVRTVFAEDGEVSVDIYVTKENIGFEVRAELFVLKMCCFE